ncbi:hypothetical protein ACS0TY_018246 [Phlomoides rotata]
MESADSSCLGVKRARKAKPADGIRRSWIELEEIILMDALKELVASVANPPPPNNVILEDVEMDVESQTATDGTSKTASMTSRKKRAHSEVVDTKVLVTALGDVFKSSDDRLDDIVNSISYEAHSATSRQNVFSMLQ